MPVVICITSLSTGHHALAPVNGHSGGVPTQRATLGQWGERVAVRFLTDGGWQIIERNWRCRYGEIDLIVHDPRAGVVAFVEVKTRRSDAFGGPLAAVDHRKAARLRRLAGQWLQEHPHQAAVVRVDVVAVWHRAGQAPLVQHVIDIA
ncbi:putative endonuclease [Branchiibius hedensis]|uniref:UPF0102 protein SAMN04489750_2008 n=1 Tax=Branchiibius hedensis TaxID=672460 RepID=A0A2Y9C1P2_9MICO|nr:putative endonuclease [Branchiibius hedensis]SSA34683.1 putative endonuclease [Branchiibius hedensis]